MPTLLTEDILKFTTQVKGIRFIISGSKLDSLNNMEKQKNSNCYIWKTGSKNTLLIKCIHPPPDQFKSFRRALFSF